MKEFPQKEWPRISLDPLIQKNDAYGTTDSHPGSCYPISAITTDNIAVRAGLHCSQNDAVMQPDLCGAPCRSTFKIK